jgi:hypothetical protein
LLLLLIVEPVRKQAIALPHLGTTVSKLLSTSQSSFANKASGLRVNDGGMEVEVTSDRSGEHKFTEESTLTRSTDRGKEGLAQSSRRSGITYNTVLLKMVIRAIFNRSKLLALLYRMIDSG